METSSETSARDDEPKGSDCLPSRAPTSEPRPVPPLPESQPPSQAARRHIVETLHGNLCTAHAQSWPRKDQRIRRHPFVFPSPTSPDAEREKAVSTEMPLSSCLTHQAVRTSKPSYTARLAPINYWVTPWACPSRRLWFVDCRGHSRACQTLTATQRRRPMKEKKKGKKKERKKERVTGCSRLVRLSKPKDLASKTALSPKSHGHEMLHLLNRLEQNSHCTVQYLSGAFHTALGLAHRAGPGPQVGNSPVVLRGGTSVKAWDSRATPSEGRGVRVLGSPGSAA